MEPARPADPGNASHAPLPRQQRTRTHAGSTSQASRKGPYYLHDRPPAGKMSECAICPHGRGVAMRLRTIVSFRTLAISTLVVMGAVAAAQQPPAGEWPNIT